MDEIPTPLSIQEVDEFLVKLAKKRCPWCDGTHWGMHIDNGDEANPKAPSLRALPRMRLGQAAPGTLTGTISIGTEAALTVAIAECQECGYIHLFNYFTIMRLARITQQSEPKDVEPSSN